jgi:hypothetical protein
MEESEFNQNKAKIEACCSPPDYRNMRTDLSAEDCRACNPSMCSGYDADDNGAAAAGSADSAHGGATETQSKGDTESNAVASPSPGPALADTGHAASASEGGDLKRTSPATGAAGPGGTVADAKGPKNGKRGGGGGGTSGTPALLGGGTTAASPTDSAATEGTMAADSGGAYKAGGGGPAGGGDTNGMPNFGSGGGISAGSGGDVSFDASGAKDVSSTGSEDPEDYFTRTGLDENLFKKIEKKIDEKERLWQVQDARGTGKK